MATVGDVAGGLGVGAQTVRDWCEEFKEFLSPTATPPKGQVRTFSESDLAVLALVARMRSDMTGYDLIKQALGQGERGELPQSEEASASTALVIRQQYEQRLSIIQQEMADREGELRATKEERDYLRGHVQQVTERAVRAETELEIFRRSTGQHARTEAPSAPVDAAPTIEVQAGEPQSLRVEPRKSWWDRLRGR
jgi:DNA-binding transcriptional MerR regulator